MKIIAEAVRQTVADPKRVFELWSDINNWNKFDESVEWAQLDKTFDVGSHFILKPRGGPKVKASIVSLEPDKEFTNTSQMPGAVLRFSHATTRRDGCVDIRITISIDGPLSWFWIRILGKDQRRALEKSIINLARLAEKKTA
jgi:polyketide cyclase/dehydrase/lipid transport protein